MKDTIRAGFVLATFLAGLALTSQALLAQQPSAYQQGVTASQAGDHAQALAHFKRARDEGNETLSLTYNLGVTHFQLSHYVQSRRYFQMLLDEPRWEDLARYNLGLIAQRRGRTREASRLFRQVARTADNDRLRELARRQIEPIRPDPDRASDAGRALYLSVTAGFDTNVIAFPDKLQVDGSRFEDSFFELLGYGQTYLTGHRDEGLRLFGMGYMRRHSDLDFFDTSVFSTGLVREQPLANWRLEYGARLDHSALDGDAITTDVRLRLGALRQIDEWHARVLYQPASHSAGTRFSQLEGTSHRIDASIRRSGPIRLTAGYRFEYNDREDLETDIEFFSYSPIRHRFQLELDRRIGEISFGFGLSHQFSRFRGTNRMSDIGGEFREERRTSDRTDLFVRGAYRLTRKLQATGMFRHRQQSDTFEFFEYDRNIFTLGLEYNH